MQITSFGAIEMTPSLDSGPRLHVDVTSYSLPSDDGSGSYYSAEDEFSDYVSALSSEDQSQRSSPAACFAEQSESCTRDLAVSYQVNCDVV